MSLPPPIWIFLLLGLSNICESVFFRYFNPDNQHGGGSTIWKSSTFWSLKFTPKFSIFEIFKYQIFWPKNFSKRKIFLVCFWQTDVSFYTIHTRFQARQRRQSKFRYSNQRKTLLCHRNVTSGNAKFQMMTQEIITRDEWRRRCHIFICGSLGVAASNLTAA